MDNTLVRGLWPHDVIPANAILPDGGALKYPYRVLDGAAEFLQARVDQPGVRVSIFSRGGAERNEALLKKLILPDGRRAWDVVHFVFSDIDTTSDFKKDLAKVNSDTSRVLIVEDNPEAIAEGQELNVIRVSPKVPHFFTSPKETWTHDGITSTTTATEFVQSRNKLAFADGVFSQIVDLVNTKGISPRAASALVQFAPDSNGNPVYREDLKNDLQYYRKGAADFHKVNPKYKFTSAYGYFSYIKCLVEELRRL